MKTTRNMLTVVMVMAAIGLMAGAANATIVVESTYATGASGGATGKYTITVAAQTTAGFDLLSSDKLVIVVGSRRDRGATHWINNATYGGVPLTEAVQQRSGNTVEETTGIYYLDTPGGLADLQLEVNLNAKGWSPDSGISMLGLSGTLPGVGATNGSIGSSTSLDTLVNDTIVIAGSQNLTNSGTPAPQSPLITLGGSNLGSGYQFVPLAGVVTPTFGATGATTVAAAFEAAAAPPAVGVVNGEFAVYKPGTGYTVRGTAPANIWVQQIGDNRPLSSGTPVDFDDGTSGMVVDIPGWITPRDSEGSPTGTADLFTLGYDGTDGTSCLNAFGAWSGQNGNLAESAAPLTLPALGPGEVYELSAMVIGDVGARTFDLLVDGVALAPSSSVDPSFDDGVWQEISRTYNAIPPGAVTILIGTARPGVGAPDLFGTRMRVDNVSLHSAVGSVIPEPMTMCALGMALAGLGGYIRKRKQA